MPFKNVNTPQKLADLEAEICSMASLKSPALVGVLTTNSVKLAVFTGTSGGPKVSGVSVSSGDEVALFSRDMAAVRSGDDVWSLVNLTHSPRIEQVARDAQVLAARPSGESALVLAWDGRATQLTMSKTEIVPREFALRGGVRTVSIGETETYVIVDGGEGGEFRVHPGATPEPGANARAPLPKEAAKLDRIAGGLHLSAIYKKGGASIVLVRRYGNRLEAKATSIDAKIVDVAVAEGALVVVVADGRILLYNRDAIEAATATSMEPTSITPLGANGEPRVALLTGQSVPTLWVGTSAGEVMTTTLVRKQPGG